MKRLFYFFNLLLGIISTLSVSAADKNKWQPLFGTNLSDASYNPEIWSMTDGVLAAVQDESIWTKTEYENFELGSGFQNRRRHKQWRCYLLYRYERLDSKLGGNPDSRRPL